MTKIEIRDSRRRRVVKADVFESFECAPTWSGLGTWKLKLPADHPAALALSYSSGIVVDRGGPLPFLSGRVLELGTDEELEGQHTLTASGCSDEYVFADRLILPTPGRTYDDSSGPAETVMRGLVDRNAGPAAAEGRRYLDLTLESDGGRGSRVRARMRYDKLLPALQDLGRAGGVGFRVVQLGTARRVVFSTPRDRSRNIVFGFDRGNLQTLKYRTTVPTATAFYAAGFGEGADRIIVEAADDLAVATYGGGPEGRREMFIDERASRQLVDDRERAQAALREARRDERDAETDLRVARLESSTTDAQLEAKKKALEEAQQERAKADTALDKARRAEAQELEDHYDALRQKIEEARVDGSATSALTVLPVESPDAVYGAGDLEGGFTLGDLVTVRDRQTGAQFVDRVAQVKLTIDGDGLETLRPVVASEGASLTGLNLDAVVRRINRRVTRLETGR